MLKIIAVIPARAGSKGIPNKNLRMINKKPLISYSIENALSSKYISDIYVSSDSEIILSIAKAYGVNTIHRDKELCKDETTLDSVIYFASKDIDCDYVVTMQPTSPTLKTSTLDAAIKYTIDNDFDTVISCVNEPHLTWSLDDLGVLKKDYVLRVNRQYMKASFKETGAFLISRKNIITSENRIGPNVNVYEVSDDESMDIDSFYDLEISKYILTRKKIAVYVNGNETIGTGHIRRVLTLADEMNSKPDIYYNKNITSRKMFGNSKYNILGIENEDSIFNIVSSGEYDVFVNDILNTNLEYMKKLKQSNNKMKIVNFDDLGPGKIYADLVVNPFLEGVSTEKTKFGYKYFVLNNIFSFFEPITIKPNVKTVFVCFGGADPQNYTNKILELATSTFNMFNFKIIVGNAYPHYDEIKEKYSGTMNITLYKDVSNIHELMLESDVAISSRGTICYELATLGIPTITIAQNNIEAMHNFLGIDNGFKYIGLKPKLNEIKTSIEYMIYSSFEFRKELQYKLLANNFSAGSKNIINLINEIGE